MVRTFASKSLDEITSCSAVNFIILRYAYTWIESPVSSDMFGRIDFSVVVNFKRMLAEKEYVGDDSNPEDVNFLF